MHGHMNVKYDFLVTWCKTLINFPLIFQTIYNKETWSEMCYSVTDELTKISSNWNLL